MLADGFYEWQKSVGRRRPMRVVLRSQEPFAFAGLWETWRDPEGKVVPILHDTNDRGQRAC